MEGIPQRTTMKVPTSATGTARSGISGRRNCAPRFVRLTQGVSITHATTFQRAFSLVQSNRNVGDCSSPKFNWLADK